MPTISANSTFQFTLPYNTLLTVSGTGTLQYSAEGGRGRLTLNALASTLGPFKYDASCEIQAIGAVVYTVVDQTLRVVNGSLVDPAGNNPYATIAVATSRALTDADNGKTLECTATVTLTVPTGLVAGFGCAIIPSGTTSIASSGGALIQGATATLTRAAASNAIFAIVSRASASNSYVATGS